MSPTKLAFGTGQGSKDSDPRNETLYRTLGAIPTGQTMASVSPLTPDQRKALEYMSKIRALTPDVKEVKSASSPDSCKSLGDMDRFDNFKDSVKGYYRQQQASYLFNKEFVRQHNAVGAFWYLNFACLTSANQVIKDVEALNGAL